MKKPLQPHLLKRVPPACKGGEDHEVAREAADWRSGPRWSILSVLCPVHPFATTWHFPSRGNKKFEEKNRESYTSCITPAFPLWWLAPSPSRPAGKCVTGFSVAYGSLRIQFPCHHFVVGLWMLSHRAMSLQESMKPILPPEQGEVRRSPDRGWRAQRANRQNGYFAI